MNRLALAWVDTALALEEERDELRELVLELAVALVQERRLAALARDQIEAKFGEERPA